MEVRADDLSRQNQALWADVSSSYVGEALSLQVRYERYFDIGGAMGDLSLSSSRVVDLPEESRRYLVNLWSDSWLGPDVNNLTHNLHTALIGNRIGQEDGYSKDETELAVRALLVHDLAEVVFDDGDEGDLTYDDSSARNADEVAEEHSRLARILSSNEFSGLAEEDVAEIERTLNDSKDPSTSAGEIIERAERYGYLASGWRAFQIASGGHAVEPRPGGKQIEKFWWMAENVLANQLGRLIIMAEDSDFVRERLIRLTPSITNALSSINGGITRHGIDCLYAQAGQDPEERDALFMSTYRAWIDSPFVR